MALDASIYGNIQPAQQVNPLANLAQAYQLRGLQARSEAADMDLQQQRGEAAAWRGAVGPDGAVNRNALLADLAARGSGAVIPDVQKRFGEQDKLGRDAEKAKYESMLKDFELAGQIMSGVSDQASWDRARALTAQAFGEKKAAQMPAAYNPSLIAENQQKALAVKDQVEQRYRALTFAETQRHNRATEGTAAGNLAVSQGNLAVSKDRLALDSSAPKGQVLDTAEGPMVVDQRTGVGRPVVSGTGQAVGPKPSEAQRKEIMSINQQRSIINGALQSVDATPDAFSLGRGVVAKLPLGETIAGRTETPEQTQARAYVFNNVSRVINERAGAAQSAQELQRLNGFLPADTDNAEQIKNKLQAFNHYLNDLETGTRGTPREGADTRPAAAGRTVKRRGTLPDGRKVIQYSDGSVEYGN